VGNALVSALRAAGVEVDGPLGRGATAEGADVVLLAVPDAAIGAAAAPIGAGPFVGHLSGATSLAPLAGHRAFSLHPLMTVTAPRAETSRTDSGSTGSGSTDFRGVPAAVAGADDEALAVARHLAESLGLVPFEVPEADRVAYHAAACVASNFLVTVEGVAERLAATAGVDRAAFVPLVRATVENWARLGPGEALTGPVARGDWATVDAHRVEIARRVPEAIGVFDALTQATRALAAGGGRPAGGPGMTIVRTVAELRAALAAHRAAGRRIGLVPTMGALHEGHLSLIRAARASSDVVVVSVFVNPTQFNDPADLAAYPRTEEADVALAVSAGADVVFAPEVAEMYPQGFASTVSVTGPITQTLEGARRGRGHFDGVATVVTKLLLAVGPDAAWFGAKDAQQVVVVRRVVADLGIPVRIEVAPTVREPDGLAMSSRNVRLHGDDRHRALALSRALRAVQDAADGGAAAADARDAGLRELAADGVEPEYLALADPDTLEPVATLDRPVLALVAAQVGPVRLIDNVTITPATAGAAPTGAR
jgi:pantoate--beta-alanine ligase